MHLALLSAAAAALIAAVGAVLLLAHRFRSAPSQEPRDTWRLARVLSLLRSAETA
jgi:hypothetical protein